MESNHGDSGNISEISVPNFNVYSRAGTSVFDKYLPNKQISSQISSGEKDHKSVTSSSIPPSIRKMQDEFVFS